MRSKHPLIMVVALVLLVAACGSDSDTKAGNDQQIDVVADPTAPDAGQDALGGFVVDGGLTVTEALAYDGTEPIAVQGFVVITGETASLCSALAESFPPQCGGERLQVANPEALSGMLLIEEADTQWSEQSVTVFGTISGDELVIDPTITG